MEHLLEPSQQAILPKSYKLKGKITGFDPRFREYEEKKLPACLLLSDFHQACSRAHIGVGLLVRTKAAAGLSRAAPLALHGAAPV